MAGQEGAGHRTSTVRTDEGTYAIYNSGRKPVSETRHSLSELPQNSLGKMTNILFKAADGTEIPGYLTFFYGRSFWQLDANQDWTGLTYSDIQDGTRWA
jgi:hypothetical protein